jgi:hypothetical protein
MKAIRSPVEGYPTAPSKASTPDANWPAPQNNIAPAISSRKTSIFRYRRAVIHQPAMTRAEITATTPVKSKPVL